MKKVIFTLLTVLISAVIILFFAINNLRDTAKETTVNDSEPDTFQAEPSGSISESIEAGTETETDAAPVLPETQALFTVDSWLRIYSIEKIGGKAALIAENISDEDVEFAVITLKTDKTELTFNISALMKGARAYLLCNEDNTADITDRITSWKTESKITYKNTPKMNEDVFEISVENGSVSLKNISKKDINSDIFIYYKELNNGLLNGSITHRIRMRGLKSGVLTYVKTDGINTDNCRIIFTDYE